MKPPLTPLTGQTQLLTLLLVYLPVGIGGAIVLLLKVPRLSCRAC
jgi:hypothetical protein